MQNALSLQVKSADVKPGRRIVAISGSPKAIGGLTSTARLYKISDSGEIVDTESMPVLQMAHSIGFFTMKINIFPCVAFK